MSYHCRHFVVFASLRGVIFRGAAVQLQLNQLRVNLYTTPLVWRTLLAEYQLNVFCALNNLFCLHKYTCSYSKTTFVVGVVVYECEVTFSFI